MFFYDSNTLKVGNYLRILYLKEDEIVMLMKSKEKIEIKGLSLVISFYDKDEVIIEGRINSIRIIYENY